MDDDGFMTFSEYDALYDDNGYPKSDGVSDTMCSSPLECNSDLFKAFGEYNEMVHDDFTECLDGFCKLLIKGWLMFFGIIIAVIVVITQIVPWLGEMLIK